MWYLVETVEVEHVLARIDALGLVRSRTFNLLHVLPLVDVIGLVSVEEGRDVFAPQQPGFYSPEVSSFFVIILLFHKF